MDANHDQRQGETRATKEKKKEKEEWAKRRAGLHASLSYRTLGVAVLDSVSHRNRRIYFQGWVRCSMRRGR